MKKNIGIILAGGSGQRMGSSVPKQFLVLNGKTVLEHSVYAFEKHPDIHEIAIVVPEVYREDTRKIIDRSNFSKVTHILTGGQERHLSTLSALTAFRETDCNLLIHDAVRPLITPRIISDVIQALADNKAVGVAIPATDTIIEVDEKQEYISRIPDRSVLFQVQTPQGFDRATLQLAFDKALADPGFHTTDDCGVIRNYLPEEKIRVVRGDIRNIKLTWPEDIAIAEKFLSSNSI